MSKLTLKRKEALVIRWIDGEGKEQETTVQSRIPSFELRSELRAIDNEYERKQQKALLDTPGAMEPDPVEAQRQLAAHLKEHGAEALESLLDSGEAVAEDRDVVILALAQAIIDTDLLKSEDLRDKIEMPVVDSEGNVNPLLASQNFEEVKGFVDRFRQ
jgi:hypothetical protein